MWSVPSHYLNQWSNIVNWILRTRTFSLKGKKMSVILSRPQCVNYSGNHWLYLGDHTKLSHTDYFFVIMKLKLIMLWHISSDCSRLLAIIIKKNICMIFYLLAFRMTFLKALTITTFEMSLCHFWQHAIWWVCSCLHKNVTNEVNHIT